MTDLADKLLKESGFDDPLKDTKNEAFKSRSDIHDALVDGLKTVLSDSEELDTLEAQQRVEKILKALRKGLRENTDGEIGEVVSFVNSELRDVIRSMKSKFV